MRFRPVVCGLFSRRKLFSMLLTVTALAHVANLFGQRIGPQFGQRRRYIDGIHVNLRQRLEQGLKARRPEEFAFIRRVVRMVENGQLSRKLVDSTFQWARKKRPYPFVFFERGLKARAARIGVIVP